MAYKKGQAKKKVNKNVYYLACYVDKQTIDKLNQIANDNNVSLSETIRNALKTFFDIK
ncbi:MAG: hypothetical protein RR839_00600 [Oscillospiraceae bacterium]